MRELVDDVLASAQMVPLLPCGDIQQLVDFWADLGLQVTYRQQRPNPYLALMRGGLVLHYYAMPDWDPELSHSTCVVTVSDTGPLYELFATGLRNRFGRLPVQGAPRITRPRKRVNNEGLTGFSLVDPAGNWIRVSRRAPAGSSDAEHDDAGRLARALDNAVVLADSHGNPRQAQKILAGAVQREADAPVRELAPALGFLAELALRVGDRDRAVALRAQLAALSADTADTADTAADHGARRQALAEVDALLPAE
ncbi:MAG TPA: VOC family protein [Microlunatus sp.]|nr:VOC family protein [Microlunatus sp.]